MTSVTSVALFPVTAELLENTTAMLKRYECDIGGNDCNARHD